MRSTHHLHVTQFSISTLLVVTLIAAVYVFICRVNFLLLPLALPFTLGPFVGYRVNGTKYSLFIGMLFSTLCFIIATGPYVMAVWGLAIPIGWIDQRLLSQSLFVSGTMAYFIPVSIVGGYVGGMVAGSD